MTAVGKILVFLNLVFSLVIGGFVVFAYVARTHWVDEYKKLENQNSVLSASAKTYQAEAIKAKEDVAALLAKKDAELKNVQADLQTALTANDQLKDDKAKLEANKNQQEAVATKSVKEVGKRQEDVGKLRETLRKEQDLNTALVKKNAELSDLAMVAQIERRATQELANRAEAELQRTKQEMVRLRSNGGAAGTARAGGKNPPQDSVEGLVKNTDPSGLMTLTIGTDAGLKNGNTLELYRLNTMSPTQSKYLGTVRILEADAHQAVAQPLGKLSSPAQPGDRVASSIMGGR